MEAFNKEDIVLDMMKKTKHGDLQGTLDILNVLYPHVEIVDNSLFVCTDADGNTVLVNSDGDVVTSYSKKDNVKYAGTFLLVGSQHSAFGHVKVINIKTKKEKLLVDIFKYTMSPFSRHGDTGYNMSYQISAISPYFACIECINYNGVTRKCSAILNCSLETLLVYDSNVGEIKSPWRFNNAEKKVDTPDSYFVSFRYGVPRYSCGGVTHNAKLNIAEQTAIHLDVQDIDNGYFISGIEYTEPKFIIQSPYTGDAVPGVSYVLQKDYCKLGRKYSSIKPVFCAETRDAVCTNKDWTRFIVGKPYTEMVQGEPTPNMFGLIDSSGEQLIQCNFSEISMFTEDIVILKQDIPNKNGKYERLTRTNYTVYDGKEYPTYSTCSNARLYVENDWVGFSRYSHKDKPNSERNIKSLTVICDLKNKAILCNQENVEVIRSDTLPVCFFGPVNNKYYIVDALGRCYETCDFPKYYRCCYSPRVKDVLPVEGDVIRVDIGTDPTTGYTYSKYIMRDFTPILNISMLARLKLIPNDEWYQL